MIGAVSSNTVASWPDWPPRPDQLTAIIQSIADHSECVDFTDHAFERMDERDISTRDVFRIFRRGTIAGEIEPGKRADEWRCKVIYRLKGNRDAGVVTVVCSQQRLLVITVEWEDI